jgi:hypothetical protein
VAEREGFEPPIGLHLCRISSAVHSTTLPPLQGAKTGGRPPESGGVLGEDGGTNKARVREKRGGRDWQGAVTRPWAGATSPSPLLGGSLPGLDPGSLAHRLGVSPHPGPPHQGRRERASVTARSRCHFGV